MGQKKSAGILLYRYNKKTLEFFLVHPGGPFWKNKDAGAWSIPKGEFAEDEDGLLAAKREFEEETGHAVKGDFIQLTPIKQKSGKMIYAWGVEGDIDVYDIKSNIFEMEWPPKSGRKQEFPEVDKGAWFNEAQAKEKINPAQMALVEELIRSIKK